MSLGVWECGSLGVWTIRLSCSIQPTELLSRLQRLKAAKTPKLPNSSDMRKLNPLHSRFIRVYSCIFFASKAAKPSACSAAGEENSHGRTRTDSELLLTQKTTDEHGLSPAALHALGFLSRLPLPSGSVGCGTSAAPPFPPCRVDCGSRSPLRAPQAKTEHE